jgi:DNA polymerase-3 subunit delta
MTDIVMSALEGLDSRVGVLVVEAGTLSKRSSLRRSFEEARGLMSLGFPTQRAVDRRRLEASLEEAGLAVGLTGEALASLSSHAAEADCGSLARTLESIAIYGLDASAPLTAEEVAALLPVTSETEVDRLVEGLVVGRPDEVVLQLGRLIAGGSSDVAIVIQIGGFFRQLLEARVLGGVDALRPPVWGQRRASLISAMDTWREVEIEDALQALHATDAALRSGKAYPMRATLERALAKLSVTAAARRTTRDRR